ncbi:MAG: hypothetical protein ACJAQT_001362 [Akkermansiaceae bacterium]|jgi:hypothetical protein
MSALTPAGLILEFAGFYAGLTHPELDEVMLPSMIFLGLLIEVLRNVPEDRFRGYFRNMQFF